MAVGTFTYTGTIGPGGSLTSKVFNNITSFVVDIARGSLQLFSGTTLVADLTYPLSATVTYTLSGGNTTVTIA